MKALTRPISAEEINFFQENGAVFLKGIINTEWVDKLRSCTNQHITDARQRGEYGEKQNGFFQESLVWTKTDHYREFLLNSGFASIPAQMLGSKQIRLFEDTLLVKEPGCPRATPWHQDLPYYSLNGNQLCTTWIPFDHVDNKNGTLTFIKGSHRWNKWFRPVAFTPGLDLGFDEFESIDPIIKTIDQFETLTFNYEPGDCSVHHGLTIHGASTNQHASQTRRAYAISFAGDDISVADRHGKPKFLQGLVQGATLSGDQFPLCYI